MFQWQNGRSIWKVTNYILLEIHPFLTKNHDDGRNCYLLKQSENLKNSTTPTNRWGFPKMVGFPNKPMGFPTRNDHDLGCEMGVSSFKETPRDPNDDKPTAWNHHLPGGETEGSGGLKLGVFRERPWWATWVFWSLFFCPLKGGKLVVFQENIWKNSV